MIEVKMIGKPKGSAKAAGAGRATAYSVQTMADTARKAYRAESADYADYAEKAGMAARATCADQAMELAEDSPIKDMFLSRQEDDTAEGLITFLQGLMANGTSVFDIVEAVKVLSDYLEAREMTATDASIDTLGTKNITNEGSITSDTISTRTAETDELSADKATVGTLTALAASIDRLVSKTADMGTVRAQDITVKTLEVTGAAHFFQLMIDQVRSVGGRVVISCADCEASHVEDYGSYYRVYFAASDGSADVANKWCAGDLAICQSFNLGQGSYGNASNKYYWRKVTGCSYDAGTYDFDGNDRQYYYIDLSNVGGEYDADSNAIPSAGDNLVQLGNWSDEERASAIVLSAYDNGWLDTEIKAPSIAQYVGVGMDGTDRWNLAKCRYSWMARNGNQITGNLRVVTGSGTVWGVTEYVSHNLAPIEQDLGALGQDFSELSQDVGDMSVTVATVEKKQSELGYTVEGLRSSVESNTTNITALSGKVDSMQTTVENHSTLISQNSEGISLNASELSSVSSAVDSVKDSQELLQDYVNDLSDEVSAQQKVVDGLPLKTDEELAEYKGEILVESHRISLELSEITDVRRNMLMGTQFWKNIGYDADGYMVNGSGATLIRRTADRVNGHNSLEISSTSASNTYGGIYFGSIPVEAGKSYTISVWAKRMSSSLGNGVRMIVHYRANVDQGTPTWQESVDLVTTADTIGEWKLVTRTITPKSGDYYVSVIFCVASSGIVRIAEPMMEESEEYTAWSPSVRDYAYVMGNLLPNTDTLGLVASGNGITATGTTAEDADEPGVSYSQVKATYGIQSTAYLLRFRYSSIQGNSYIFSFWARRTSDINDYAVLRINFGSYVYMAEYSTGVSMYSQDQGTSPYNGLMSIPHIPATWTRYWVHVVTYSSATLTPRVYVTVTNGSATVQLKKPKLELGAAVTEWTASEDDLREEESVANQLHKTGINITQGTIRLSADNTIIDGDLHLRGVLVENYEEKETGALVVCDLVQNKSVSVNQAIVVLPMATLQVITSSRTSGDVTVAAVRESGVKVTIAAKYQAAVAKWAMATPELYASYSSAMSSFHSYCTKVFADPRVASKDNYTATDVATVLPEGGGGYTASGYEGGVFVCNGRRGRILLLMPGQTLHLTSAIETINGSSHLLWYVDNGCEFCAIEKTVSIFGNYWYDIDFHSNGGSSWPNEVEGSSGSETADCLFAPEKIGNEYSGRTDKLEIEL